MRAQWVGKRQAERTKVQLRGQLRLAGGRSTVDCTIIDISATGARIIVPEGATLPEDFDVFIFARNETKWARLRWATKALIGVEFLTRDGIDSSVVERLVGLERRFAEFSETAQAKVELANAEKSRAEAAEQALLAAKGLENLGARLTALESRAADRRSDADASRETFSRLEARLAEVEARLSRLEEQGDENGRRQTDVDRRFGRMEERIAAQTTEIASNASLHLSQSQDHEPRLRVLEDVMAELRSSLRTLMTLTSTLLKQTGGADARPASPSTERTETACR